MGEYKPPFHLTEEIMSLAMEIGESIGAIMVDTTMSPDPKLRRESRVRSIYSSLAIEQNTLSLDQVDYSGARKALVRRTGNHQSDHLEIIFGCPVRRSRQILLYRSAT